MIRFEVWLVNLDPAIGSEILNTRPAIIVSPDELNQHLGTVVVVPLTTGKAYPFRLATQVLGKEGVAAIDQIRTVDKRRLVRRIATLKGAARTAVLQPWQACLRRSAAPRWTSVGERRNPRWRRPRSARRADSSDTDVRCWCRPVHAFQLMSTRPPAGAGSASRVAQQNRPIRRRVGGGTRIACGTFR